MVSVVAMIGAIVLTATAGDVLIASAMRSRGSAPSIATYSRFVAGGGCMALSFFALLYSLSHADVSLVAPAAGSLTFVTNAIAARWLLKENVDRRRWVAAVLVCCGVALLKR